MTHNNQPYVLQDIKERVRLVDFVLGRTSEIEKLSRQGLEFFYDPAFALSILAENSKYFTNNIFKAKKKNETIDFMGIVYIPVVIVRFDEKNTILVSFQQNKNDTELKINFSEMPEKPVFENTPSEYSKLQKELQLLYESYLNGVKFYSHNIPIENHDDYSILLKNIVESHELYRSENKCFIPLGFEQFLDQLDVLVELVGKIDEEENNLNLEINSTKQNFNELLYPFAEEVRIVFEKYNKLIENRKKQVRQKNIQLNAEADTEINKTIDNCDVYIKEYMKQFDKLSIQLKNTKAYYVEKFESTLNDRGRGGTNIGSTTYNTERPVKNPTYFQIADNIMDLGARKEAVNIMKEKLISEVNNKKMVEVNVDRDLSDFYQMIAAEAKVPLVNYFELDELKRKIIWHLREKNNSNKYATYLISKLSSALLNNIILDQRVQPWMIPLGVVRYVSTAEKRIAVFGPVSVPNMDKDERIKPDKIAYKAVEGEFINRVISNIKIQLEKDIELESIKGLNLCKDKEAMQKSLHSIQRLYEEKKISKGYFKGFTKWMNVQ
ncbi:MAG: hypothetical protein K8S16_08405 [Bacteroidales bacterium]|nr:hypothetical protein [Bacteroidales bacterium]